MLRESPPVLGKCQYKLGWFLGDEHTSVSAWGLHKTNSVSAFECFISIHHCICRRSWWSILTHSHTILPSLRPSLLTLCRLSLLFAALHTHSLLPSPRLWDQELALEGNSTVQLERCGRWPARGCHGNSWISFTPSASPEIILKWQKKNPLPFKITCLFDMFPNANPWHVLLVKQFCYCCLYMVSKKGVVFILLHGEDFSPPFRFYDLWAEWQNSRMVAEECVWRWLCILEPVAAVPCAEGHLGRSGFWGVHVCRGVSRRGPSGAASPVATRRTGKPSSLSKGRHIGC